MKIEDYKKITEETAIYPKSVKNFSLAYCWLGLIEECTEAQEAMEEFLKDPKDELLRKALVKEMGDVCWYVTSLAMLQDLSLEEIFHCKAPLEDLYMHKTINAFSGYIKKYYRDKKDIKKEEFTGTLSLLITGVFDMLSNHDITLEEVLQTNYDKLTKRKEKNLLHGDGDNREEE